MPKFRVVKKLVRAGSPSSPFSSSYIQSFPNSLSRKTSSPLGFQDLAVVFKSVLCFFCWRAAVDCIKTKLGSPHITNIIFFCQITVLFMSVQAFQKQATVAQKWKQNPSHRRSWLNIWDGSNVLYWWIMSALLFLLSYKMQLNSIVFTPDQKIPRGPKTNMFQNTYEQYPFV